VQLKGVLGQGRDCCVYRFRARAGQTLTWSIKGATTRQAFTAPNGETDGGPELPPSIPLPVSGDYLFAVSPNLMAEDGFGPFTLTLKLAL
jgi:hypothetical protein